MGPSEEPTGRLPVLLGWSTRWVEPDWGCACWEAPTGRRGCWEEPEGGRGCWEEPEGGRGGIVLLLLSSLYTGGRMIRTDR